MNFFEAVYRVVCKIPKGRVATYGQIAYMVGNPHASRAVGYALHSNPQPDVIPCHRVVNKMGRLAPAFAFGGVEVQRKMLEKEGVFVSEEGYVDMEKYRW